MHAPEDAGGSRSNAGADVQILLRASADFFTNVLHRDATVGPA
jgi:hypothetical protein